MNYAKSSKLICIILYLSFLLAADRSFAQEKKGITALFEKKVAKFEKFFSSKPKLLEKEAFSDSPTGYIFSYVLFTHCRIS